MSAKSSFKRKRTSAAGILMVSRPYKKPMRAYGSEQERVARFYGRYSGRSSELKFHDVDLDDAVIGTGGTVTPTVNIIPQGVTEVQRIGRKCTLKVFQWRYVLTLPEQDAVVTPETGDSARIIVFIDKQANGATATVTDLLESASILSFRNLANSGRFVFLCDKLHNINYAGLASDGAGVVSQALVNMEYTFYAKLNTPIEFSGTTGVIAEIRSNNIGVLLISQQGRVTFNSKIRLRFSDM